MKRSKKRKNRLKILRTPQIKSKRQFAQIVRTANRNRRRHKQDIKALVQQQKYELQFSQFEETLYNRKLPLSQ